MGRKRPWQLYSHLPLARPEDVVHGTYSSRAKAEQAKKELLKRHGKKYYSFSGYTGPLRIRRRKK